MVFKSTPLTALLTALLLAGLATSSTATRPCHVDPAKSELVMVAGSNGNLLRVSASAHNAFDQGRSETLLATFEPLDEFEKPGPPIAVDQDCAFTPSAPGAECGVWACSRDIEASWLQAVLDREAKVFTFRGRATLAECPEVTGPDGQSRVECAVIKTARSLFTVDQEVQGDGGVTVTPATEIIVDTDLETETTADKGELMAGERATFTLGVKQEGFAVVPEHLRVQVSWLSADGTQTEQQVAWDDGEGYLLDIAMRASADRLKTEASIFAKPPASQNGVRQVEFPATLIFDWEALVQVPGQVVATDDGVGKRRSAAVAKPTLVKGRRTFDVAESSGGGVQPSALDMLQLGMTAAVSVSSIIAACVAVLLLKRVKKLFKGSAASDNVMQSSFSLAYETSNPVVMATAPPLASIQVVGSNNN